MGEKKSKSEATKELTIDHLTAGLLFVENWCRAARLVLDSLPPEEKKRIRFPATLAKETLMDPEITRYRPDGCEVKPFAIGQCLR